MPAGSCATDGSGTAIVIDYYRLAGMGFAACAEPWWELVPVQAVLTFMQVSAAWVDSEIPRSIAPSVIFLLSLLCLLAYS